MSNGDGVTIQSLARAFEILELFKKNKELGISDISAAMGLSKSTVYGLVNTMVKYKYIRRQEDGKKYSLGLKLFEMGSLVENRMDIRTEAKPFCQLLSEKYQLTVHLATHYEGEVMYIDKFDQPDFIITYSQVGKRAPMTCTGVGKAMLAYESNDYMEKYIYSKAFAVKTPASISSKEQLTKELEKIKKLGYAEDNGEIEPGLRCVAAPIFNYNGKPIAAISVSGTLTRIDGDIFETLKSDVLKCAKEISADLGFKNEKEENENGRRKN